MKKILISRTDGIGDVLLTLPMAGLLKDYNPKIEIVFLGRSYTQSIIESCDYVDRFVDCDVLLKLPNDEQISFIKELKIDAIIHVFPNKEIARLAVKASIPIRVGTSHRIFHWFTCNKLVNLGRNKSDLHEAQLNVKLLSFLGIENVTISRLTEYHILSKTKELESEFCELIDKDRFNIILHPKSKGSAREWGFENYGELIRILPADKFKIFISGTSTDRVQMQKLFEKYGDCVTDITGLMSLDQFVSFISKADGFVAASTGPLHIAASLGKVAIGIYAPMRPIHPGRWAPIGKKVSFLVADKKCDGCRKSKICECIMKITPKDVYRKIIEMQVQ